MHVTSWKPCRMRRAASSALADRSALIGKVEYWNFIFEHLAGDRTDAAQA